MEDYIEKTKEFMRDTGCSVMISLAEKAKNPMWNDVFARNKYAITITTERGVMNYYYWDSIYNTRNDICPTVYDVLSCLTKYDCGTFECFCNEFGYSDDSRKAFALYQGCVKEYEDLSRIFTEEQLEKLREIE